MPSDWDDELAARCGEASYESAAEKLGIYSYLAHDVLNAVDHDYPIRQAVNDTLDALRELADELDVHFYEPDQHDKADGIGDRFVAASKLLWDCGLDAIEAADRFLGSKEEEEIINAQS